MWQYEHSVTSAANPADVYRCYEDIGLRCTWDRGLSEVKMDGPFAVGTNGTMVIDGQSPIPFRIVAADHGERFVDETELVDAGLTLRFNHDLLPGEGGGTTITHRLTITGPNVDRLGEEFGHMITADFPEAMKVLACLAERLT